VRELMRRDPTGPRNQTLFQYSLTFPLANLVLLLVGLPILLRHERGNGVEGSWRAASCACSTSAIDFVFPQPGLARTPWTAPGGLATDPVLREPGPGPVRRRD
jgi:hypothetical protein